MKRSMRHLASVLACSAVTFGAVSPAWAGYERVDPGEDYHVNGNNPDEIVLHANAAFSLERFEETFKVDRPLRRAM